MKALLLLLVTGVALGAETGVVGFTTLYDTGCTYVVRASWGGARELFEALTEAEETKVDGGVERHGEHVTCTQKDKDYECVFELAKDGSLVSGGPGSFENYPSIEAHHSTWRHSQPSPVVKVKLMTSIAEELMEKVAPLEEGKTVREINDLRCGKYRARKGRMGFLMGTAKRCYVGFTPTGKAIPATQLP